MISDNENLRSELGIPEDAIVFGGFVLRRRFIRYTICSSMHKSYNRGNAIYIFPLFMNFSGKCKTA